MPSDDDDQKFPDDEAPPRKRRRSEDEDEKPRIANSERMPILMLFGLIVGSLLILSSCGLGGWFMWSWLVAGGSGGSGGGSPFGTDFEVTAIRTNGGLRPNINWSVTAKKAPANGSFYFLVVRSNNQNIGHQIYPDKTGWAMSGSSSFAGPSGAGGMEVWVEKRSTQSQLGSGTVVSNVYKVP